ncbi:hypothetical protein O7599_17950 [Streptomyces sp. WMMC500]|uniref:hypothetical protein n=1 Tax=Streptomyces sp. WMMC500 TaxID=3015154 RepID=UPI00248C8B53|nr:hypothetical protein [Streptomyces sp. WMMC500]WBB64275.1 hypothetical protein O7599_17950 [Streptomyces sp. WMMC500]
MSTTGTEAGAHAARSRALAVLRVRGAALGVVLLPAAAAVVLLAGSAMGRVDGVLAALVWPVVALAVLVPALAAAVARSISRAEPAATLTVPVPRRAAPDLYRLVGDLAERLGVPVPAAVALTPDCDSWLEDPGPAPTGVRSWLRRLAARAGRALRRGGRDGAGGSGSGFGAAAGSGTGAGGPGAYGAGAGDGHGAARGPAAESHAAAAAARRQASAEASYAPNWREVVERATADPDGPVLVIGSPFLWWMRVGELRAVLAPVVAGTAASAQPDIAAARRFVRALDAAAALPSRAAPGSGETPGTSESGPYATGAGTYDAGQGPYGTGPGAALGLPGTPGTPGPYATDSPPAPGPARPDRRARAARLWQRLTGGVARLLLRACGDHPVEMERAVAAAAAERAQAVDYGLRIVAQEQVGLAYAGWDRLLTRVALPAWRMGRWPSRLNAGVVSALTELSRRDRLAEGFATRLGERPACDLLEEPGMVDEAASLLAAELFSGPGGAAAGAVVGGEPAAGFAGVSWEQYPDEVVDRKWRLEAARLHAVLDRLEDCPEPAGRPDRGTLARVVDRLTAGPDETDRIGAALTRAQQAPAGAAAPLTPPRTGRELLVDHVLAMVCCAAVDTAGAAPGLDWLDGPVLRTRRGGSPAAAVRTLVETRDDSQLRSWLTTAGVRAEKPVLLV